MIAILTPLLYTLGPLAILLVMAVVFVETGLLLGFFLPGDSLLFTVGLLVSEGKISFPLWFCAVVLFVAAMVGNACGYAIGTKAGPSIFQRDDSKIFKKKYVEKTREFFEKYGNRAVVLARFVPVVRTFITVMAGAGRMNFRTYAIYTVIGGVLWTASSSTSKYSSLWKPNELATRLEGKDSTRVFSARTLAL